MDVLDDPQADNETRNRKTSKLSGYDFWRKRLNCAKLVVAPMVDQSELAWRMLSRRHGAQLCYTPMFHSSVFVRDANYRRDALASCPDDKPLIIQFCGNNPDVFLRAAKLAEEHCEAVDLNLGCPQIIAKRGHYGAYLQDEWTLLYTIVNLCHKSLKVPITCKVRVFNDIAKTVEYAKMLEDAGCQLLTVHGRTLEQKGPLTGVASWHHIKAVKEAVTIPVFANGNIQYMEDVNQCLDYTGVDGVMTAEGNLHNPALFEETIPTSWSMAEEYMKLVEQYPCPLSYTRGHLFKLFHHVFVRHTDLRERMAKARNTETMNEVIEAIRMTCQPDVEKYNTIPSSFDCGLPHPYWMCQPYVRPSPKEAQAKQEYHNEIEDRKRHLATILPVTVPVLSKRKQKKESRHPHKKKKVKYQICDACPNPRGLKCDFSLCKTCCKKKTKLEILDCVGHDFLKKSLPYCKSNSNKDIHSN